MHRDDEDFENGPTYTSEHAQYFDACERGMFASPEAAHCGCRGAGWFLSQIDTWHKCPVHYTGQPHPDAEPDYVLDADYTPDAAGEKLPLEPLPLPPVETIEIDGDEIPF